MTRNDPGLLEAVARVGSSLLGLLHNRLELASIEAAEARERLVFTIIASFAAVLLFGGAVVALSAWVAVALWPAFGAAVLIGIALAYGLVGAAMLLWLRSKLHNDPPLLADTLAELRTDAATMRGTNP
jgi:uncharacterized membrane protein YqjE